MKTDAFVPDQIDLADGLQLRHFTVVDANDGEFEAFGSGCRRDRVAALGLVPVGRGEAHVDVLAGAVAGPRGDVEAQGRGASGLGDRLGDCRDLPSHRSQSPQ